MTTVRITKTFNIPTQSFSTTFVIPDQTVKPNISYSGGFGGGSGEGQTQEQSTVTVVSVIGQQITTPPTGGTIESLAFPDQVVTVTSKAVSQNVLVTGTGDSVTTRAAFEVSIPPATASGATEAFSIQFANLGGTSEAVTTTATLESVTATSDPVTVSKSERAIAVGGAGTIPPQTVTAAGQGTTFNTTVTATGTAVAGVVENTIGIASTTISLPVFSLPSALVSTSVFAQVVDGTSKFVDVSIEPVAAVVSGRSEEIGTISATTEFISVQVSIPDAVTSQSVTTEGINFNTSVVAEGQSTSQSFKVAGKSFTATAKTGGSN